HLFRARLRVRAPAREQRRSCAAHPQQRPSSAVSETVQLYRESHPEDRAAGRPDRDHGRGKRLGNRERFADMKLHTAKAFEGLEEAVRENEPLAPHTWYRIGGPARWYVRPQSVEQLQEAAQRCIENNIRIYVLGLGANLLVSDRGVDGAVFRLDEDYFRRVKFDGITLEASAGVDMQKLVIRTVRQGLAGIECLAGIPGTIGGGVRMNAGGKFGDIGGVITRVLV